jgi:hypothetical protein
MAQCPVRPRKQGTRIGIVQVYIVFVPEIELHYTKRIIIALPLPQ